VKFLTLLSYEGPICFVCNKPSAPGQACSPECAARAAETDGVVVELPRAAPDARRLIVQVCVGHGCWEDVKEPRLHPDNSVSYLGDDGRLHRTEPGNWRSNGPVPPASWTDLVSLEPGTVTAAEEQRRSFAHGNVSISNPDVTRAVVDRVADKMKANQISRDMAVADDLTRALSRDVGKVPRKMSEDPVILALAGDALRKAEGRPSWSTTNLPGRDTGRVRAVLAAIDSYLEEK
jgi:hypothetical protein